VLARSDLIGLIKNNSGLILPVPTWEPTPGHRHISIGTANPTVRTRKHEVVSCSVADPFPTPLSRSVPHTFEENIAAEKANLEAQIAQLKTWPSGGRGTQKDQATGNGFTHERVAFVSRTTGPDLK
jgi:hypothetical protein